ncbi:hypothetical protein COV17_03080 [Candidatus Woesearchaeota archaeon CG10_big_fil_rev_8_21_14_0_10_36_11]|nr:MAG: hypothetical protein COV17_03080 [Candidatus Woesearchaeota archaeon CG10_big_fil_rev_8_21_14_0_10_36_11]
MLEDLKYDVEALKKKLTQPDAKSNELILEIESLKDSVHELTDIFKKALGEIKDEDDSGKTMIFLREKVGMIASQNETIARGMIAISEKVEDWMNKQGRPMPSQPMYRSSPQPQHVMGPPPSFPGPGRIAPRPSMSSSLESGENENRELSFPPPPPNPGKEKRGIFS